MSVMENQLLKGLEADLERHLLPKTRADYEKVVVAGMRVALNAIPGSGQKSLLGRLNESKDVVQSCSVGAGAVVLFLFQESKFRMPGNVIPFAAQTLFYKALDTAEKAGILKVTTKEVDRGTYLLADYMLAKIHISPEKFKMLTQRVHDITNDPTQMEALSRRSGISKDAMASTPSGIINTATSPVMPSGDEEMPPQDKET